jgi:hypothetical protein
LWVIDDNELSPTYKKILNKILSTIVKVIDKIPTSKIFEYLSKLVSKLLSMLGKTPQKIKMVGLILMFVAILTSTPFKTLVNNTIDDSTLANDMKKIENVLKKDIKTTNKKTKELKSKGNLNDFLKKLAESESSNNWKSIKYIRRGKRKIPRYVGKYQFGDIAFRDIGSNVRVKDFVKNPNIWTEEQQDKDIVKLLNNNKHYLRKKGKFNGYNHYIGKKINNIDITESGILAAAHLIGNKGVKKFLMSNGKIDPKDGNGTKCSDYMKKFANYNI